MYFVYSPIWDQVSILKPNDEETAVDLAMGNPDHIYFYAELGF